MKSSTIFIMLGIIPPFLVGQVADPAVPLPIPTPTPATISEATSQPSAPTPTPSVAPPESSIESLPIAIVSLFSSKPGAEGTPNASLSPAALDASQLQDSQSKNWQNLDPNNAKFYESVRLGDTQTASTTEPNAITSESETSEKKAAIANNAATPPLNTTTPNSAIAKPDLTTVQLERQQLIEQKLAELVARDKPIKDAQRKENLIAVAIDYANQGQFELARQVIQDESVPSEVQANVVQKISELEAENARRLSQRAAEERRLAESQRRLAQAPSLPRSWRGVGPTTLQPINLGPFTLSDRGLGVGTTIPIGREYNSNLLPPGLPGNGNLRLLFPLPTPAPITSGYGWRQHPILGNQRFHSGVDIGAPEGTPVVAAYSGKVSSADYLGGYGLAIVLEHNNGTQDTLYAHLSQVFVRPGEEVPQGAVIGRVGSTGLSTGPHLHFEMRQRTTDGWTTLDPNAAIEAALAQLVQAQKTAQQPTSSTGN